MLFGPAYKGIPLAASDRHGAGRARAATCRSASTARKPRITARAARSIGAPLDGRVLIVDDVISAGTSVRESVELIRAGGRNPPAW